MTSQGRFYRVCRRILRLGYRHYRSQSEADNAAPVVYICRHRNAIGPIASLCLLPLGVRPWAFSAFMEREACKKHLREYTFPVTWHLSPPLSRLLAAILGPLFAHLVCSTGAVPVYRNSLKVRETFLQTISALEAGDSILIFPDVNYAEKTGETGSLYDGFLLIEQLWNRRTGEHIRFVPLNVSLANRTLTVGRSISFTGSLPYPKEKDVIVRQLEHTLNDMAKRYGA